MAVTAIHHRLLYAWAKLGAMTAADTQEQGDIYEENISPPEQQEVKFCQEPPRTTNPYVAPPLVSPPYNLPPPTLVSHQRFNHIELILYLRCLSAVQQSVPKQGTNLLTYPLKEVQLLLDQSFSITCPNKTVTLHQKCSALHFNLVQFHLLATCGAVQQCFLSVICSTSMATGTRVMPYTSLQIAEGRNAYAQGMPAIALKENYGLLYLGFHFHSQITL